MSDFPEKCVTLMSFVSGFFILFQYETAPFVINWIAFTLSTVSMLIQTPNSNLIYFWRTIGQTIATLISAILLLTQVSNENNPVNPNALIFIAVIQIFFALCVTVLLILLPLPTNTKLNGMYKSIGTLSFNLPRNEDIRTLNNAGDYLVVQCWFPLESNEQTDNYWWNCFTQKTALLWTSGHPTQQVDESTALLNKLANIYGFPNFIFKHLSLARTNSLWQYSFTDMANQYTVNGFTDISIQHPLVNALETASRGRPIVLHSHGMYSWRQFHHSCCENLASHGYVVFACDHDPDSLISRPLQDTRGASYKLFDYNISPNMPAEEELDLYHKGIDQRVNDLTTLLDFITTSNKSGVCYEDDNYLTEVSQTMQGKLDCSRIFGWGMSFGGGTIATLASREPKLKDIALLDPWMYPTHESDLQNGWRSDTNVLSIASDLWVQVPYIKCMKRRMLTDRGMIGRQFDFKLKSSDHLNFCETSLTASTVLLKRPYVLGPVDPQLMLQSIDMLIICFFNTSYHNHQNRGEKQNVSDTELPRLTKDNLKAALLATPYDVKDFLSYCQIDPATHPNKKEVTFLLENLIPLDGNKVKLIGIHQTLMEKPTVI